MPVMQRGDSAEWLEALENHLIAIKSARKAGEYMRAIRAAQELVATAEIVEDELMHEFRLANPGKKVYANRSDSGL